MIFIGDIPLTESQANRICGKINKMKHIEQSQGKIEELIRKELDYLTGGHSRIKNGDKTKGFVLTMFLSKSSFLTFFCLYLPN